MFKFTLQIVVLVLIFEVFCQKCDLEIDSNFIKFRETSNARCIDGTFSGIYYRPIVDSTKWLIHFEGGGWSFDARSLSWRSKTKHGTSSSFPLQLKWRVYQGYENLSSKKNPHLCDWNYIKVPYCDSSSFAGDALISYKDSVMYVKGKAIRDEAIKTALELGMKNATEVIISGCSAGGLAVYLGLDDMADIIRKSNQSTMVVGLADSGHFMKRDKQSGDTVDDFQSNMRAIYHLFNMSAGSNIDCVTAEATAATHYTQSDNCVFATHLAAHIRTPLFSLQSQYDSWQIRYVLGWNHSDVVRNAFGHNMSYELRTSLLRYDPHQATAAFASPHGIYVDSCFRHCLFCVSGNDDVWDGNQLKDDTHALNPAEAFHMWYEYTKALYYQRPSNIMINKQVNYQLFEQKHDYPCFRCCKCARGK